MIKKKELEVLKKKLKDHKTEILNNYRYLCHNKKYNKTKFFDKRKLLRKLKQVKKERKKTNIFNEICRLESEKLEIESDLYYIEKFPKHMKYVSVIASRKKKDSKQLKIINFIKEFINKTKKSNCSSDYKFLKDEKTQGKEAEKKSVVDHELHIRDGIPCQKIPHFSFSKIMMKSLDGKELRHLRNLKARIKKTNI